MRSFKRTLLAGAIALAISTPAAAQFSGVYFFGDSLTDMGSYKPVLPPGTGLFTTNPGPVWAQPFAEQFGFSAIPFNQSGGNDYAMGGAYVTQSPGYSQPSGMTAVPVSQQIQNFLKTGPLNSNAIYSVWAGNNEVFQQADGLIAGKITAAQAQANMVVAATQLAVQVSALRGSGAQYIMVWNLPDIGNTPSFYGTPLASVGTGLTDLFNSTYFAALNASGIPVIRLNDRALLNEMIANPAAFGFTNARGQACTGVPSSLVCTPASLVSPNAAQTYMFADGVHPTTAGHAILAQYAASVIVAPQEMSVLGQQPLDVEKANWRTLDGRMVSAINGKGPSGNLELWAAYDYGNPDYSSFQSGNANVNTIAVGGDMKLSAKLLMGMQFAYSESKADYGSLSSKLQEPMGTFYVGYGDGPWYLGATLGAGGLNYDTTRNIALGALNRSETGNVAGWQSVGRLLGGYWFNYANWQHGPTLKLTYQDIRVRQFEEKGANSTTMSFGQQDVKSFQTSVGWQASGQYGNIRPFGRVTWEYDADADPRNVTASVYGMGGSFTLPGYKPDNNYALFNVGATSDFGKVTGYLTGSASAGKSDGDFWAVTVGIRVPL